MRFEPFGSGLNQRKADLLFCKPPIRISESGPAALRTLVMNTERFSSFANTLGIFSCLCFWRGILYSFFSEVDTSAHVHWFRGSGLRLFCVFFDRLANSWLFMRGVDWFVLPRLSLPEEHGASPRTS